MSENRNSVESRTSSANAQAGNNGAGASSLQTLGAALRDRRENAGIGLAQVEKATRIRQKYLAAIEADEWHLLPGEVVGRGFLRNYANFLNLDANQMIERRRAMVDNSLARTLSNTSAEAQLPPVRPVDYRPKDVDLEYTPVSDRVTEFVESGRDWLVPVLAAVAIVLLVLVVGWGVSQMSGPVGTVLAALQERATGLIQENWPTASRGADTAPPANVTGSDSTGGDSTGGDSTGGDSADSNPPSDGSGGPVEGQQQDGGAAGVAVLPTDTPTVVVLPPTATPTATDTPVPLPTPTETPLPLPIPTDTPIPLPTATPVPVAPVVPEEPPPPTPEPQPVVVPVNCGDSRMAISSPGANQTVSGVVPIVGRAVHEQFQYYKLEFAPGTNAGGGFVYFDGTATPVENGVLGNFNSTGLDNGPYTLMLTVVDTTGNYPTPCRVTVNVQN